MFGSRGALGSEEVKAREAAVAEHMDGATFHPMSALCSSGRGDLLNDSGLTLAHGHGFEVGRCFFWDRFARAALTETPPTAEQLLGAFFRSPPEPLRFWRDAMQLWIDSLSDPVPLDLDWRDRFYLEQRLGAWSSVVQRGSDILDGTFFYPGNCLWVFHLLLRHSPRRRLEGFAQREAIRLMAPRLAAFPINPRSITERLRQAAKTLLGARKIDELKSLAGLIKRR